MIVEIIFTELVPVPGYPNYVRPDRFASEEGWTIIVNGEDVTLERRANMPEWHEVKAFTVHGFKYSLRLALPEVEAPFLQPSKFVGRGKR